MADLTPYSTAAPWFGALPQWASEEDRARLASYTLYESIYWGIPETWELTQRGTDDDPIYVPSARIIVESTLRFLAVDWDYYVDPALGTPEEQGAANIAFKNLFKRESMWSKFASQKRFGLIRGDAMWHITADELKQPGSRIAITELDPGSYFPIYDIEDLDKLVGCHIVDLVLEDDVEVVRRQTYRKEQDADGNFTGIITSELTLFETAGWDDRNGAKPEDIKQVRVVEPETPLPPQIRSLPVYHWKNLRNSTDDFGSSQMRGIERLAAAVNQTITDQDLAVALAGLGVYVTTSAPPVDDDGNDTNWIIGPGRVVELDGPTSSFDRVQGVTSVEASLSHAEYLESKMREGASVPGIATGDVDVQAAESGIALAIKLAPLLSANKEKEQEILGVMNQMMYDLQHMWFPAYEALTMDTVSVSCVVGDPMPVNRAAKIEEIIKLATSTPPLISIEMAQAELAKLGYSFGDGSAEAIVTQQARLASANDPYAGRVRSELENEPQA